MNNFKATTTSDEIGLQVSLKTHRAIFKLKLIESPSEHIKLISDINEGIDIFRNPGIIEKYIINKVIE